MNEFLESRNPVNQEFIGKVLVTNIEDINTIVEKSKIAQKKKKKNYLGKRNQKKNGSKYNRDLHIYLNSL